jgi:hypothetical protein
MPSIARPTKVYDFTAFARREPTSPPPGDRLDAQIQNHADAIVAVQLAVESLAKTQPAIDVHAIAAEVRAIAQAEMSDLRRQALNAQSAVAEAKAEVAHARADADRAREAADRSEARFAAALAEMQAQARASARMPFPPVETPPNSPLEGPALLGPNTGGKNSADVLGAIATSADYAQVSIEWAEHMPDTVPPNILAINSISGDHWSSRWWANRAANAFGMLAWWYMGAWPSPGPPTTPLTPTGQPIPPGAMYYDTTDDVMMVWSGSTWNNAAQGPSKATTSSLYYLSAANQTVFPLTVADRNGQTFAFNQATPEGLHAHVNGVRVEPTYDYTLNTVASSVTFLRPITLNAVVIFDILTPTALLTPSGTVNTVLLSPIVPDGVKTAFTGLTVAMNGHATNVAKNEELLVSVDGVIQQPGAAYNASGSTITFAEAPMATAVIFISWFGPPNP